MKLLTKELADRFKKVGSQDELEGKNVLVICKFFNPAGAGTWYATEYNPQSKCFYGYAIIHEGEWGYFSLEELETLRFPMGLKIERDLYFKEEKFFDIARRENISNY